MPMRSGRRDLNRPRLAGVLALALLLSITMSIAACGGGDDGSDGGGGDEETVTLSAVSFLPPDHPIVEPSVPEWIEAVERESGGSIEIDFRGGPEAIPTEDQFSAVADGLVDINFNVPNFYLNDVPAGNSMHLSPFTPAEERENGYFDFLDEIHREAGAVYLGRWISSLPFWMWSNDRVSSLDDLSGQRMRSSPTYQHIFDALAVESVNIVPPEVFTALERGVVDGFAFPMIGPRDTGWLEVTRFLVNAPFYNQNAAISMNLESFESLSDEQRQAIETATREFEEGALADNFLRIEQEEWEQTTELVDVIELEPQERQDFNNLWYEETWTALVDLWNADQAVVDEAKQLLNYDEISGDPDAIRQIPCAGFGDRAADQPFCGGGESDGS